MIKSNLLTRLCFGLPLIAFLFSVSLQIPISARRNETFQTVVGECEKLNFRSSSFFHVPRAVSAMITADFNNDKIPDIAAPMQDTNSIAVALGDNQSGFSPTREFIAGVSPQKMTAGDFDHDGEIDLAVTSKFDQLVNILRGDGTGNFVLTESYPVGRQPGKVVTADFNNDGWLDLIVSNLESQNFSVYLGGLNGFVPAGAGTVPFTATPNDFEPGDFNRDGKIDFIAINANSVRLLIGDGLGGFTNTLTLNVPELYVIESADFNNDDYPDFATLGFRDAKVRVYFNDKNGGFNQPQETLVTWSAQYSLMSGDLNNDGSVDLQTGGFALLNDGSGNFTLREVSNAVGDLVADFNGDGLNDLAFANGVSQLSNNQLLSTFGVSYGLGNARFQAPTLLPAHSSATSLVAADLNNDGRVDIASALPSINGVQVSFQNPDGSFTLPTTAVFAGGGSGSSYISLTSGDYNNDGNIDLAFPVWWQRRIYVLLNNGSGQFTATSAQISTQFSVTPQFVQTGDFNNDGWADLVVTNESSYSILLNNGSSGGFTPQNLVSLGSINEPTRVAVGDFNADGKSDLAITRGSTSFLILRGNGDGTFASSASFALSAYATMVRSSDLNSDNRADFVVRTTGPTNETSRLFVFFADANGGFTRNDYTVPGSASDVIFNDFNGDGIKDFLIISSPYNSATLMVGDGSGAFSPQDPIVLNGGAHMGAVADLNQDQKLDLILAGGSSGTGIYYNETPKAPCLSVEDYQVVEGDSGTTDAQFTVNLSGTSTEVVTVDYRVVGRNARAGADFDNVSGTLEFAPGTQMQTLNVPVRGDTVDEDNETFQIVLSNPSNASLTDNIGVGTINDDDASPSVSISDASVTEGSGADMEMIFNVSLSAPTGRKAKVEFTTVDATATVGMDFTKAAGTVFFNEGETIKQIVVKINPDFLVEPDETFKIKLSNPISLLVSDEEAIGSIINDDVGGTVQFETAVVEAGEAEETVIVNIRRSGGNAGGIVLDYSTSNGTATANQDYLPAGGKLIFGPNETLKTFVIPILDDAVDEDSPETINLTLGSISGGAVLGQSTAVVNIDDDDPPPFLTITGTSISEGNSGTIAANFNVQLQAVSGRIVTVNFSTSDGTANVSSDYQNVSGTLTFSPGEIGKTISVLINGDSNVEPNETFFLNLSSPVNGVLQNAQATATIVNDDSATRRAAADFDGDGKTDISVFRPAGGNWFYLQSSDDTFRAVQFGAAEDKIAPGDFDGDAKTDFAVFRPSTGAWYILESQNSSFRAVQFGAAEDKPVTGDYDGDGKFDVAVFRPSAQSWFILRSSDGSFTGIQFGASEDKPVPADYDGDGKTDTAVFRSSTGNWFRLDSSNGQFVGTQFGSSEDKPVAADYDGDGRTDLAVFRPSTGTWYLQQSSAGFTGVKWGIATDQPAPGDYDGDGKSDIAVFRAQDGAWYINQSSNGFKGLAFGANGDIAVPSGYHPN